MIYAEDSLKTWTAPLSETEEQRVENAVRMIKETVTACTKLADCNMEIFAQGSICNIKTYNSSDCNISQINLCILIPITN